MSACFSVPVSREAGKGKIVCVYVCEGGGRLQYIVCVYFKIRCLALSHGKLSKQFSSNNFGYSLQYYVCVCVLWESVVCVLCNSSQLAKTNGQFHWDTFLIGASVAEAGAAMCQPDADPIC